MIATFFEKTGLFSIIGIFIFLFILSFLFTFQQYGFHLEGIENGVKLFLAIGINLYILLFIVKNHKLTLNNTYSGILFILISLVLLNNFNIDSSIFSTVALLFSFFGIYGLYNPTSIVQNIFHSGFWIGVATLFLPWNSLFLLLIVVALFANEINNLKNILIAFTGWIAPVFLGFTYKYWFDEISFEGLSEISLQNYFQVQNIQLSFNFFDSLPNITASFFMILLLLGALVFISPKAINIGKKFVSTWKILFAHIGLSVFISGCIPSSVFNNIVLAFPLSIVFTIFIQNIKKETLKNSILLFFMAIVLFQLFY